MKGAGALQGIREILFVTVRLGAHFALGCSRLSCIQPFPLLLPGFQRDKPGARSNLSLPTNLQRVARLSWQAGEGSTRQGQQQAHDPCNHRPAAFDQQSVACADFARFPGSGRHRFPLLPRDLV